MSKIKEIEIDRMNLIRECKKCIVHKKSKENCEGCLNYELINNIKKLMV